MPDQGLPARAFSVSRGATPAGRILGALLTVALLVAAAAIVTRLAGDLATTALHGADLADLLLAAVAVALAVASRRLLARGFGPSPRLLAGPLLLAALAAGAAVPAGTGAAPPWVLVVAGIAVAGAVVLVVRRLRTGAVASDLVGAVSPTGVRTMEAGQAGTAHLAAAAVATALGVVAGAAAALAWLAQVA